MKFNDIELQAMRNALVEIKELKSEVNGKDFDEVLKRFGDRKDTGITHQCSTLFDVNYKHHIMATVNNYDGKCFVDDSLYEVWTSYKQGNDIDGWQVGEFGEEELKDIVGSK